MKRDLCYCCIILILLTAVNEEGKSVGLTFPGLIVYKRLPAPDGSGNPSGKREKGGRKNHKNLFKGKISKSDKGIYV